MTTLLDFPEEEHTPECLEGMNNYDESMCTCHVNWPRNDPDFLLDWHREHGEDNED